MRRILGVACVILGLAGCGDTNPATMRLTVGQKVRVRVEPPLIPSDGPREVCEFKPHDFDVAVRDGTRAEVIGDEARSDIHRESYGDGEAERRMVSVRLLSGRFEGSKGFLSRNQLRPD